MSQYDAPDWQNIITLVPSAAVSDAPDWQTIAVGPGGGSVPGGNDDWQPSDLGLVGWTCNPLGITGNSTVTLNVGLLNAFPIKATISGKINYLGVSVNSSGTTFTANENYVGLYTVTFSAGSPNVFTLVASSAAGTADITLNTNSATAITQLSSSYSVTAGTIYYVGLVCNYSAGTPHMTVQNGGLITYPSNNTSWTQLPSPLWGTSLTTLPASETFAAASQKNSARCWVCMF